MTPADQQDAKKSTLSRADALRIARAADEVYAAKGKSVVHLDLRKEPADDETLAKIMLGPTGNLRAPTLRCGGTLLVGFDAEMYRRVLQRN